MAYIRAVPQKAVVAADIHRPRDACSVRQGGSRVQEEAEHRYTLPRHSHEAFHRDRAGAPGEVVRESDGSNRWYQGQAS